MLARGDDVVPIPGTKRRAYLEENVAAADVELTPADLAAIDEVFPADQDFGDRYPDMSSIGARPRRLTVLRQAGPFGPAARSEPTHHGDDLAEDGHLGGVEHHRVRGGRWPG